MRILIFILIRLRSRDFVHPVFHTGPRREKKGLRLRLRLRKKEGRCRRREEIRVHPYPLEMGFSGSLENRFKSHFLSHRIARKSIPISEFAVPIKHGLVLKPSND